MMTVTAAATTIGWALLHSLWQGAIIAAGAWLVLAALPITAARARYAVAFGALLSVTLVPMLTVAVGTPQAGAIGGHWASFRTVTLELSDRTVVPSTDQGATPTGDTRSPRTVIEPWLPVLAALWALGVCIGSIRYACDWQVARHTLLSASPTSREIEDRVRRLARRLAISRPVRVLLSLTLETPVVIGWLRPAILLPMTSVTGLSQRHLEAILAHELAHIKRHDYLVNLLHSAIETLLFYHPAAWWLSSTVRQEREHRCDDVAVGTCRDVLTYARALTELEQLRVAPLPAVAATGGDLMQRIRRLVIEPREHDARNRPLRVIAGLVSITIGALLLQSAAPSPAVAAAPEHAPSAPVLAAAPSASASPRAPSAPAAVGTIPSAVSAAIGLSSGPAAVSAPALATAPTVATIAAVPVSAVTPAFAIAAVPAPAATPAFAIAAVPAPAVTPAFAIATVPAPAPAATVATIAAVPVTAVTPAFAIAAVPAPAPAAPLLAIGRSGSSVQRWDGGFRYLDNLDGHLDLALRSDGPLELDVDTGELRDLPHGSSFELQTSDRDGTERLKITTAEDGTRQYDWTVNGRSLPFTALAERWMNATLKLATGGMRIRQLHGQRSALRGQISALHGQRSALRGQQSALRGQKSALRGQISAIRGQRSTLRGQKSALRGHMSALRGQMRALRGRLRELRRRHERGAEPVVGEREQIEREINRIEREVADGDVERQVAEIERKIESLDSGEQTSALEAQIRALEVDSGDAAIERQIEELDIAGQVAAIERQIERLEIDGTATRIRSERIEPALSELERIRLELR